MERKMDLDDVLSLELAHEKAVSSSKRSPSWGPNGALRGYRELEDTENLENDEDEEESGLQNRKINCGKAASSSSSKLKNVNGRPHLDPYWDDEVTAEDME